MKLTSTTLRRIIKEELETFGIPEAEQLAKQIANVRKRYEDAHRLAVEIDSEIPGKDRFTRSTHPQVEKRDKAIERGEMAYKTLQMLNKALNDVGGSSDYKGEGSLKRLDFPPTESERDAAMDMYEGKITNSTLRKIIREELEEVYKSDAQREREMNADIRAIKKDPEFRALIALEKAYHGRNRSIDDEAPHVRYILLRRSDWKAMSPDDAMRDVIRDMSPGLYKFAAKSKAMQPYFGGVNESKLDDRFNAVRNAVADILNALGKRRKDLSIAQREGLPNLAARVVDGEMTVKSAAKKLGASIREAVENETLFNLVKDAGIPMMGVDRNDFFNFLRARELTTADAIESHMGVIAGWLKKNR